MSWLPEGIQTIQLLLLFDVLFDKFIVWTPHEFPNTMITMVFWFGQPRMGSLILWGIGISLNSYQPAKDLSYVQGI